MTDAEKAARSPRTREAVMRDRIEWWRGFGWAALWIGFLHIVVHVLTETRYVR